MLLLLSLLLELRPGLDSTNRPEVSWAEERGGCYSLIRSQQWLHQEITHNQVGVNAFTQVSSEM